MRFASFARVVASAKTLGLSAFVACLLASLRLGAQTWDGGAGTGTWATANNWNPNGLPGAGANLTFNAAGANNQYVITLANTNRTVGSMTFVNAAGAQGFTFNAGTAILTINGTGITNSDADTQTFNSGVTVGSAQTWNAASGGLTFGAVTLSNNLTVSGAGNVTVTGVISGAGVLNMNGTGTFITDGAGANTNTGAVNINSGTFQIDKTAYVGAIGNNAAVSVASGATLRLNGAAAYTQETIGSLSGAGTVTNVGAAAVNLITGGNNTSTTFSGVITNTTNAINLQKSGTGTFTLSGANAYTGTTTINAGVLNIQNNTALGTAAGGTTVAASAALQTQGGITVTGEALTLNGTGLSNDGALRNISGNNSWTGAVTLGSASRINSDAGTLTLSGNIGGNTQNLTVGGAGNTSISGVIGTTTGTLTKDGAGTLTLSGVNTYTGATNINAGALRLGANDALSNSTAVTVASGATLNLNNYSDTVGSLAGAGIITLGSGTLTVGANNASTTFSGSFTSGDTGTFAKTGTGTLTFGAGMNLSAGNLVLNGGTLNLGGFNSTFGTLSVTANSILDFGTSGGSVLNILNSLAVNSGVTLTIANWTDTIDYFYSLTNPGATNLGRIVFTGFTGPDTKWLSYDHQVTPVPEPSVYGAALLGLSTLIAGWRLQRRRTA